MITSPKLIHCQDFNTLLQMRCPTDSNRGAKYIANLSCRHDTILTDIFGSSVHFSMPCNLQCCPSFTTTVTFLLIHRENITKCKTELSTIETLQQKLNAS